MDGLSSREAARRLEVDGPNELARRAGSHLGSDLLQQLIHPLALLLWAAAALSLVTDKVSMGIAIVVVILLNATFSLIQERHAEHAVEALATYLPPTARVVRDGAVLTVPARDLVRGDVIELAEGERVSADARVVAGSVVVDLSMLTGESVPVTRSAGPGHATDNPLEAPDLVFSGTTCTQGDATAVVLNTGMHTEIGRIAALSQRVKKESSPLEQQVNRVARLIAYVSVGLAVAFIPVGMLAGNLSFGDTISFAISLLVANVPEGLLPTITLALAVGVRMLARDGALIKRISSVETLGSTSVICTDKTGTLTVNRMQLVRCWTPDGELDLDGTQVRDDVRDLLDVAAVCTNATWTPDGGSGDPTEVALVRAAVQLGPLPEAERLREFAFDPALRRMTTVDLADGEVWAHVKGAPEDLLPLCLDAGGERLDDSRRATLLQLVSSWAEEGLRILAVARRPLSDELAEEGAERLAREDTERGLSLLGFVAMIDPPRPEVRDAVAKCHAAGIRLIIITGDHGLTAKGVAMRVGIGDASTPVVTGRELDAMSEHDLDTLLATHRELIFARSSPEAKLRITDALRSQGYVVAMTGDGVNDSPALRRADIGVAMGRSGTDVAREAATMVLTDDNFATIVTAVAAGRRVYDNVRKFIVYIFAHATPEVIPFLAYELSGGRMPLPMTVMQILAIDLVTETLPALALGREPAEPGIMERPPRQRERGIINGAMLMRAWGLMGAINATAVLLLFLGTLWYGGWHGGADVSTGPLHHVWQQATTMTFLGIVACQIGTAIASRTQLASLRSIGLFTNPLLMWGIGFEIVFSVALVTLPWLRGVFGTAVPPAPMLLALVPLPFLVWGADELWRWRRRVQLGV